ncbi:tRNA pseudouridine(54/55) synthase Pus10 [Halocalculus aciditolerans]|uniref:tRNA pseudouridine synthase Pus10 n=1 Tax=Halocalculus aciditolerans TaxID=1383812 RepID=A0A830FEM6_9EURY|nr:tRNA pseudouridine(54/55) synthase Pus10 [Halocalculus aciditolerans]GGL47720.1 tRNA pseudouridine(54/55) synthase Pus10 [Halocalculus aciditolerans]
MSLLEDARGVLAEAPVCDACVGRCFAERSFGLTNAARGRALRTAVALDDDEPYEPVDASECWVCEGLSGRFDAWSERIADALVDVEFATYQVGTQTPPLVEENEVLLREAAGLDEDAGELFKSECNREVGKRVGRLTETEVDFGRPDVLVVLDAETDDLDVQINPAFVYGRYRKLSREIPQTEWPCRECGGSGTRAGEPCIHCDGSGYMYPESVEQLTTPPVREAMQGDEAKFHGAGREDIDALMLGTGRPFVIEVKHPRKRFPDVEALEGEINAFAGEKVEVEGLRLATYDMVERVKELDASKTYRARVEFDEPVDDAALQEALDELRGATVHQDTPERVDHRRAAKTRTREVYDISGELTDETHATIEVHGEGGLYIKELVSSDNGRTEPSVSGLVGVHGYVTELDVVSVEGEDEAFEDPAFFLDE